MIDEERYKEINAEHMREFYRKWTVLAIPLVFPVTSGLVILVFCVLIVKLIWYKSLMISLLGVGFIFAVNMYQVYLISCKYQEGLTDEEKKEHGYD